MISVGELLKTDERLAQARDRIRELDGSVW